MEHTLSSITTEIASHLGKELDEPFKRLLADKVDGWRSTLLRRTLKENPNERIHFRQTLFVTLSQTKQVPECIDENAPVCDIMRSTLKLPAAVRAGSIVYDFVGSIDGNHAFQRVDPGTNYYLSKGKYSGKIVTWDEVNDYLEVYNALGLPLMRVDGVFDKPSEVAQFNCDAVSQGCDYWNERYPVSGDIKQAIVQSILAVDFNRPTVPSNKEVEVTPKQQQHEPDGR